MNKKVFSGIKPGNAAVALLYAVYFSASFFLYYRQQHPSPGPMGDYFSDLPSHVSAGADGSGYSLLELIYGLLVKNTDAASVIIALLLAFLTVLCVYFVYRIFRIIVQGCSPALLHTAAFMPTVAMPLFLYGINPYKYLGMQCGVIWHNDTYTGMRTAAALVIIIVFTLIGRYREKLGLKDMSVLFAALFVTNWIKPNFIMAFGPAFAVFLLCDCIKDRGKTISSQIKFMIPAVLSLIIVVFQAASVFGESGSEGGIGFSVAYLLKLNTYHPVISILQSAAFPLFMLIINIRKIGRDRIFSLTWLIWLFGFIEYIFIHEEGSRKDNGNFTWGYSFCVFLVMTVCLAYMIAEIKELIKTVRGTSLSGLKGSPYTVLRIVLNLAALLLILAHTYWGLHFALRMILGAPYYI